MKPSPAQFVRVEFQRGGSVVCGAPRHPWSWSIVLFDGHVYFVSKSFATLAEATADFTSIGIGHVAKAESYLAEQYRPVGAEPYYLNVINDHRPFRRRKLSQKR